MSEVEPRLVDVQDDLVIERPLQPMDNRPVPAGVLLSMIAAALSTIELLTVYSL